MGHEQPSTTLNLYTHAPIDYYDTIRRALAAPADYLLTFEINDAAATAANHDQNRTDLADDGVGCPPSLRLTDGDDVGHRAEINPKPLFSLRVHIEACVMFVHLGRLNV
jgi:hypothetical protein